MVCFSSREWTFAWYCWNTTAQWVPYHKQAFERYCIRKQKNFINVFYVIYCASIIVAHIFELLELLAFWFLRVPSHQTPINIYSLLTSQQTGWREILTSARSCFPLHKVGRLSITWDFRKFHTMESWNERMRMWCNVSKKLQCRYIPTPRYELIYISIFSQCKLRCNGEI